MKIDWSEVRAVCVAAGYRAAAEGFGIKEATIRQRACRERWFDDPAIKAVMASRAAMSRAVTTDGRPTAAVVIAESLLDLNKRTRLGLARSFAAAADRAAELDGEEVLERAEKISHVTRSAGMIHGWRGEDSTAIAIVTLPASEVIRDAMRRLSEPDEPEDAADEAKVIEGAVVG